MRGLIALGGRAVHGSLMSERPGRNDPCHCGSGKKYKKCHADADEAAESARLKKAAPQEAPGANAMQMMMKLREMAGPGVSLEDLHGDISSLATDMTSGDDPQVMMKTQGVLLDMLVEDGPLGALRFDREKLFSVVTRNIEGVSVENMEDHMRDLFERCLPELSPSIPLEQWQETLRNALRTGKHTTAQRRALMLPLLEGLMGTPDDAAGRSTTVLPTLVFIRQCQDELSRAQLRLQQLRDEDPDASMDALQDKLRAEGNPFLTLVVKSAIAEVIDENKAAEGHPAND